MDYQFLCLLFGGFCLAALAVVFVIYNCTVSDLKTKSEYLYIQLEIYKAKQRKPSAEVEAQRDVAETLVIELRNALQVAKPEPKTPQFKPQQSEPVVFNNKPKTVRNLKFTKDGKTLYQLDERQPYYSEELIKPKQGYTYKNGFKL